MYSGERLGKQIKCKHCSRETFLALAKNKAESKEYRNEYEKPKGWFLEPDCSNTAIDGFWWVCLRCAIEKAYQSIAKNESEHEAESYMKLFLV